MADFFDEKGEKVEGVMTKDEYEAALAEAAKKAGEDAVAAYKKDHPDVPAQDAPKPADADVSVQLKELTETVGTLKKGQEETLVSGLASRYAGSDAAKQSEYKKAWNQLTGFADTPEGIEDRSKAAARLAFGSDTPAVNVNDVAGTGSGRNVDEKGNRIKTDGDKVMERLFGISDADREKYGPKGQFQGNSTNS